MTEDALARDLTYAVMRHYGYTPDAIAAAEQIHPGRVCGDDCEDEDGQSVHPAYDELNWTASLMVDVVEPLVTERVRQAQRDALTEAADAWTHGEWADAPRRADRIQERIANGQHVGDWLRARAEAL